VAAVAVVECSVEVCGFPLPKVFYGEQKETETYD
jgi:hypothetical protein